jgi:hypothetical protein
MVLGETESMVCIRTVHRARAMEKAKKRNVKADVKGRQAWI